jgi:acyl-CoA thioester hydrolase
MPLTYERTFRVRHYECDAYGHVNNANYLRYMQEAALDASAAAGYDLARHAALGTSWLVRFTDIEYFSPLRYGESVVVSTWVHDIRRVRSQRVYAMTRAGSGERVAHAVTDWVYINTATGQPVTVPDALIAAFFPEGVPPQAPPRERPPEPPPPPPGVFSMRRRVTWQDLDPVGHVNNAQYVAYISDCGFEVASAYGWPGTRMRAEGFGILVRELHLHYRQPAVLGDELEIDTWAYGARRVTAHRAYVVRRARDGAVLMEAHGLYAWVNLASGQPVRIPASFMEAFRPNFVGGG